MTRTHDAPPLPPDATQALQRIPGCEQIDLLLPDSNGLLRGKRITRDALDKIYRDGVCLPMSLIATDITGNTVEETGLGYAIGDEDRLCFPIPGTLQPVPWAPVPSAQLLLTMRDDAGDPLEFAPREVLARVLARLRARGLTPVIAVELEFYLFDPRADADGRPQPPLQAHTGLRNDSTQVYYMQELDDQRGFTDAVAQACRAQGIPADTAVAEYAPGQFEINLKHRGDALAACDDALMLKRAIKAIAQQQGLLASFMAKPFAAQSGSGLHLHVSLLDAAGDNVFAGTAQAPADALRHAIGGLQRSADDCLLLFAPHANSYRRFVPNAFVPLNDSWGFNNRTVAMRVPYSDPSNTRIEHRIAGADANPYLVAAAVLAGIEHGLQHGFDPGPPVQGNAYAQTQIRHPDWRGAIADFLASDFVAERFGSRFRHVYGQQKRREMLDFHAQVSDLDYRWYLRTV
ncbi:glutamine synthetase family protein [Xanthomonas translucens]|uniref:Gamma-glutamylputrescine synthetase n=2 Tax=Xanthomonas campestris pv. translucens TaxID=343 RepID=A0A109HD90_XANCT|nr:glutamine synthetase family protein [Xanthomonas translucens]KTF37140.1 gamma-glutamylputrescine synthetase [Xanthomonas translucens pv. translucens]KWV10053.1 gamma-glutamylputrescine synthetase [Xanthomonas translucens]KWV10115.1 gamma-glutamylputrescine synthetase [Xanthomonas translucens]MCS3359296.1 glutamine synthetase family protein [Xanthomonas translucens pv. translucens]MCS3372582.1 glutamine synthetase family protein [Xanthomonas translucens pv. translucens]